MSYVHLDDKYGHLTQFRERLSDEVRVHTGEEFSIFQDRKDILWGQNWQKRIEESIDEVTFLIPIITPSFFNSSACRYELQRFIEREKELKRNDLILPVYYVDCPLLNDGEKLAGDELAHVIATRQYADWRELRHEPFTSPHVGRMLEKLAVQIRDALERVQASEETGVQKPDASEPPTRVVDQMHRGDYLTITEAIEAADPGDRILVRPGTYQEGLVIEKPLEIIGDGEPGEVVVEAKDKDALLFETTMGRVVNLTLRQMGGVGQYGVNIVKGRLELEGCDVTSHGLACVAIHGGADPRLRGNRIHDGKRDGVVVYENGQGVLDDNDIFENAFAGVEIIGGNTILHRNCINKNGYWAVSVFHGGGGTIEDNDLRGNARGAWYPSDDSEPNLRRARNKE